MIFASVAVYFLLDYAFKKRDKELALAVEEADKADTDNEITIDEKSEEEL